MRDYWEPAEWDENYKSRSQKKRESSAMQQTGKALAALAESELVCLPLSPALRTAVMDWKKLKKHEALRRQMQYIGRLMREEPDENAQRIQDYLDERQVGHAQLRTAFHKIETWRERLLDTKSRADALAELSGACPGMPDGQLRHILELADSSNPTNRKKGARELFRLLKTLFESVE